MKKSSRDIKVGDYVLYKNDTYKTIDEGTVMEISNGFVKVAPVDEPFDTWIFPSQITDIL